MHQLHSFWLTKAIVREDPEILELVKEQERRLVLLARGWPEQGLREPVMRFWVRERLAR